LIEDWTSEQREAFDRVSELAHVARPAPATKPAHGFVGEAELALKLPAKRVQ